MIYRQAVNDLSRLKLHFKEREDGVIDSLDETDPSVVATAKLMLFLQGVGPRSLGSTAVAATKGRPGVDTIVLMGPPEAGSVTLRAEIIDGFPVITVSDD